MPIDANIAELAQYATDFQKLKDLRDQRRDGSRPPEAVKAAERQLDNLRSQRAHIKSKAPDTRLDRDGERQLQERGIFLQTKLNEVLLQNPGEYLTKRAEYERDLGMSSMEAEIFKTVAIVSNRRNKTIKGVTGRFLREARKKLGRPADDQVVDEDLKTEVGKLIFKAKTFRSPSNEVYWQPSPLGIVVETTDSRDVLKLNDSSPGGHYEESGILRTRLFWLRFIPFIFVQKDPISTSQRHEEGHAENAIIRTGLGRLSGKLRTLFFGEQIAHNSLRGMLTFSKRDVARDTIEKISKKVVKNGHIEQATDQAVEALKKGPWYDSLTEAKDEIIADFEADGNFSHLQNLRKLTFSQPPAGDNSFDEYVERNNSYQELSESGLSKWQLSHAPEFHDAVANRYNDELRTNVGYMEELWNCFKQEPDAQAQAQELIAFMRQNPLQVWRSRGENYFGSKYTRLKADQEKAQHEKEQATQLSYLLESSTQENRQLEKQYNTNSAIEALRKRGIEIPEYAITAQLIAARDKKINELRSDNLSVESVESLKVELTSTRRTIQEQLEKLLELARQKTLELEKTHPINTFINDAEALRSVLDNQSVYSAANDVSFAIYTLLDKSMDPPLRYFQQEELLALVRRYIHNKQLAEISELSDQELEQIAGSSQKDVGTVRTTILREQFLRYAPILAEVRKILAESSIAYESGAPIHEAASELRGKRYDAFNASKYENRLVVLDTVLETLSHEKVALFESLPNIIKTNELLKSNHIQRLKRLDETLTNTNPSEEQHTLRSTSQPSITNL